MKWILLIISFYGGSEPMATVDAFPVVFAEHDGCSQTMEEVKDEQAREKRPKHPPERVEMRCVGVGDG